MAVKKGSDVVRTMKPSEARALKKKSTVPAPVGVNNPLPRPGDDHKDDHKSAARPITDFPDIADALTPLVESYREGQRLEKEGEKKKEEAKPEIAALLGAAGHQSIRNDDARWIVTRSKSERRTISATKLMSKGIKGLTMDVINDCTDVTEYYQITVRTIKDREE